MISLERYRNKEFVEFCQEELANYVRLYHGIGNALLATPDGFEVASYSGNTNHSADKLAAVGSSLFALGVSLVDEFNLKDCRSIILDSEKGKVYISAIRNMQLSIILMVQTTDQATLGNVIHGVKKLHDSVGQRLNML